MSEPRKHHYLPQFYLAHFADEKEGFWQYEKTAEAKSYGVRVKDAGAIRDFHKLDYKDAQDPNAFEKELARVEDYLSIALKKIIESKIVVKETRPPLVELVSSMRFRVPSVRDFIESFLEDSVKATMELMKLSGKHPEVEKIENEIGNGNLKVKIANWAILRQMYALACDETLLNILFAMKISLYEAPEGTDFITSDQPVSFYHPTHDADSFYGVPFTHPDSELTIPIGRRFAAKFVWTGNEGTRVLSPDEVVEINRRTVIMAQKYIFAPIKDDQITGLVSKNHKFNAGFEGDFMQSGEAFFQIGKMRCVMPAEHYK